MAGPHSYHLRRQGGTYEMLPLRCVSRNRAMTHFEVVFEELSLGPTLSFSKKCPNKGASKVITSIALYYISLLSGLGNIDDQYR